MQMPKNDFRQHQRKKVNLSVEIAADGKLQDTHTLNVSPRGIALSRPQNTRIEPGQHITVRFSQFKTRRLRAQVVHVGDEHVGLSITSADGSPHALLPLTADIAPSNRLGRAQRWFMRQTRRAAILAVNTPLQPVIIQLVKPQFLFAAYGTRKEANVYFTPWMERLLPKTIVCGLIRANGKTGFMVASTVLEDILYSEGHTTRSYLQDLAHRFPSAERVALVGRLPNFAKRAGVPLESPFVDGAMGTRFMIRDAALHLRTLPGYQRETGITVLGGAGRIGDQVCQDLLGDFSEVIAFDKRYVHEEIVVTERGRMIRTSSTARLNEHRLFIGLTHHGDAIRELAEFLPQGGMIADDTHPCISPSVRAQLLQRGVSTMKIVLTHERFSMTPRMPAWNAQDIPGCLVEALVLLENGEHAIQNLSHFATTAKHAGFRGTLVPPPAE